ncbi:MAG: rhodanese family protein [Proteobacteria bacterium]|nr:rhodanese family protein [Pseudomonadota bacterium]
MSLPTITPEDARRRLADGSAVLVDIREPAEHARENIAGARLAPLSKLAPGQLGDGKTAVIFHCQSGNRTNANAAQLSACAPGEAFVLAGGLNAWKAAGNATKLDRRQPIEMQRQVQIAAGSLVVIGLLLAVLVNPWFAALSAFVGSGLMFAGISGWCGMAKVLAVMPWNRVAA